MRFFFFYLMIFGALFAQDDLEQKVKNYFFTPDVTTLSISDWLNPTPKDYLLIEGFLKKKVLSIVNTPLENRVFDDDELNCDFHGWVTYRMNRGCLAKNAEEQPEFCINYLNNDPDNKDRCVICYASFPSGSPIRDYPKAVQSLLKSLEKTEFSGHFIYQIGGFPNVKKGRLKFCDVPFAFKPFLFEQVRDLGYKNILWLDACCIPVKSLDPVFQFIEEKGLCFHSYNGTFERRKFNEGYSYIIPFIDTDSLSNCEQISSQIVGINVQNAEANNLLDQWIKAAEIKIPFLLSDEPPLAILINQLNLFHGRLPDYYYVETACNTGDFYYWKRNPQAIIYHQYDFLSPEYSIQNEIFNR